MQENKNNFEINQIDKQIKKKLNSISTANIDIVEIARKWVNTPFHLQGRKIGAGCDCVGLVLGVADELKAVSRNNGERLAIFDENDYRIRKDSKKMLDAFDKHLVKTWQPEDPEKGKTTDEEKRRFSKSNNLQNLKEGIIIGIHFGGQYYHSGIISEVEKQEQESRIRIIHACQKIGYVAEQVIPDPWLQRIVRVWRYALAT